MGLLWSNYGFYLALWEGSEDVQYKLSDSMVWAWAHYERDFLQAAKEAGELTNIQAQDKLRDIFNDAVRGGLVMMRVQRGFGIG